MRSGSTLPQPHSPAGCPTVESPGSTMLRSPALGVGSLSHCRLRNGPAFGRRNPLDGPAKCGVLWNLWGSPVLARLRSKLPRPKSQGRRRPMGPLTLWQPGRPEEQEAESSSRPCIATSRSVAPGADLSSKSSGTGFPVLTSCRSQNWKGPGSTGGFLAVPQPHWYHFDGSVQKRGFRHTGEPFSSRRVNLQEFPDQAGWRNWQTHGT